MTDPAPPWAIDRVDAAELYDLRRRVLREGRADAVVANGADDDERTRHYAGRLDGLLVVSASFFFAPGPDGATYQLRYMATEPALQGRGYGAAVLAYAEGSLADEGVRAVWANARDVALDFYRRAGWRVLAGTEFVSSESMVPHTVIVKKLAV